jgi:muramoyltetrapeptide carboxypeptidase
MVTKPIKAERLRKGDRIGVIAPAGPVKPEELAPGIQLLQSAGYEVQLGRHLYEVKDYLAGTDASRLWDLHDMFAEPLVKAIICARGGYGTMRILDRLDYGLIRDHPKILLGYSDITALLWALYKKIGLLSFHGPMVKDLTKNKNRNFQSFLDLLSSHKGMIVNFTEKQVIRHGRGKGILLGGNLSLIFHLAGTPFMPSLRGVILFIEDRGESLYRIDRILTSLRLMGVFKELAGLVVGNFQGCGDPDNLKPLLIESVPEPGVPIVFGLPVGHGINNLCLPLGLPFVLDAENRTLSTRNVPFA